MSIERIRRRRIQMPEDFPQKQQASIPPQKYRNRTTEDYKQFIGLHNGDSFVICACGSSLNDYTNFNNHITIGVNDAGTKVGCKYLVVVNEPKTFKWNRWPSVRSNNSDFVFTHLSDLPIDNPEGRRIVVNLGKYEGLDLDNHGFIDYTTNSPYMAIIIAYQMGARKIALVGVDFTPNHFFAETGNHIIMREIERVKEQYSKLGKALTEKGIRIANLSQISLIESWPKMTLDQFETL
jgi:hypothetical protein